MLMILLNSKASKKSRRKMQECLPLALTATSLMRDLVQTCDQIAFEPRLDKSQMIMVNHNLVYDECFVNKTAVWGYRDLQSLDHVRLHYTVQGIEVRLVPLCYS